jgi:hypothetical protein
MGFGKKSNAVWIASEALKTQIYALDKYMMIAVGKNRLNLLLCAVFY